MTVSDNTIAGEGVTNLLRNLGNLGKVALRGASYLGKKNVQAKEKMGTNALEKPQRALEVAGNTNETPVEPVLDVIKFYLTRKWLYLRKVV